MAPLREMWERAGASLRRAILQATQRLDARLAGDPHGEGESRGERIRILFERPLGVLFEVDEEKRLVRVLRSWAYGPGTDRRDCWG